MIDIDKYTEELKEDTRVDELNLLQKQLMLPGIKHKWVSRLISAKRLVNSLNKKKKMAFLAVHAGLESQNAIPPGISKTSLEKKIENSDSIQKIVQEIEDTELTIEYLEKVESIFRSMTYDIKNIIDINKLETT
jgi:hypothetical protein